MTDFRDISLLLILTSLICCCCCEESLTSVIQRLNQFNRKLHDNKKEILGMEENVLNLIEVSKTALRAELKENLREQVREAMFEILHGNSLQDMVKSEVISELKLLKRGYHQLKRQMAHFSKSLKGLQDKVDAFQQPRPQKAGIWDGKDSYDGCVTDKHRLEVELYNCNVTAAYLKSDIDRLLAVNETCHSEISKLKQSLAVNASLRSVQGVNTSSSSPLPTSVMTPRPPQLTTSGMTARPSMSTTSVMTPRPHQVTMSGTTVRPEEEKRRILIAPRWSHSIHQFRQLNIHSNTLSVYQYLTMIRVSSIAYIAKTKKLLIGLYSPNKILSSSLDTSYTTVVRGGVWTHDMAVDEERDIVFMSTVAPQYAIGRMSTQGTDFTAITYLSQYGRWPEGITLDKKQKQIYVCNGQSMFLMTYDGQGFTILTRGTHMYAVIWDQTAGVLYYNNEKKLMRMIVSSNVSTEVTTLSVIPWSMRLYRGTIYYGSYSSVSGNSASVGAVGLTFNTTPHILQSLSIDKVPGLYIQLIP
ncbi:uncharacterized protein [Haliotis asinina]|uniref:uncharacterized protein n=1 Tax=Haliotis asinina TaxID=109174 RepID=UPI003531A95A